MLLSSPIKDTLGTGFLPKLSLLDARQRKPFCLPRSLCSALTRFPFKVKQTDFQHPRVGLPLIPVTPLLPPRRSSIQSNSSETHQLVLTSFHQVSAIDASSSRPAQSYHANLNYCLLMWNSLSLPLRHPTGTTFSFLSVSKHVGRFWGEATAIVVLYRLKTVFSMLTNFHPPMCFKAEGKKAHLAHESVFAKQGSALKWNFLFQSSALITSRK